MIAFTSAGLLLASLVQLDTAIVEVRLSDSAATVRAVYHISSVEAPTRFVAIRIDEQTIEVIGPRPSLTRGDGALEFAIASPAEGPLSLALEYSVIGDVTRIPVFVPSAATDPATSVVELRVTGYRHSGSVGDAFPRFAIDGETIVSYPENLPSFILLPNDEGLSTNRVADALVVALVVIATLLWIRRHMSLRARARQVAT